MSVSRETYNDKHILHKTMFHVKQTKNQVPFTNDVSRETKDIQAKNKRKLVDLTCIVENKIVSRETRRR